MKTLLLVLPLLVLASCATNPNKAEPLNLHVNNITILNNETVIGVKDGSMVYQKKILIGEELRLIQNKSYEIEARLYGGPRYYDNTGLLGVLRNCNAKLSAMEDGKLKFTESRDYVIPDRDNVKIGLDEKGKIAGVTEEFLKERIERFQGYKEVLLQRTEGMEDKIRVCEAAVAFKAKQQMTASKGE